MKKNLKTSDTKNLKIKKIDTTRNQTWTLGAVDLIFVTFVCHCSLDHPMSDPTSLSPIHSETFLLNREIFITWIFPFILIFIGLYFSYEDHIDDDEQWASDEDVEQDTDELYQNNHDYRLNEDSSYSIPHHSSRFQKDENKVRTELLQIHML